MEHVICSFYVVEPRRSCCRCPHMETTCATVKRTAIKLVRATMEEIQYLLLKNKEITHNIKILHLLRDPRGRFNSFF